MLNKQNICVICVCQYIIVIRVTFAKPGFTMTNKLPKEVLRKLGKIKGLFWKCDECLDLKI